MTISAGRLPVRRDHQRPSYARELLETAARSADRAVAEDTEWERDVDHLLRTEQRLAQVGDASAVMRCLCEGADEWAKGAAAEGAVSRRPSGAAAAHGAERSGPPDAGAVRAYHMLRCLRTREQRWRLLGALNFFRFAQRRLVAGLEVPWMAAALPEERQGDLDPFTEAVDQGRYWDLSARQLWRTCRSCPPLLDGAELHGFQSC